MITAYQLDEPLKDVGGTFDLEPSVILLLDLSRDRHRRLYRQMIQHESDRLLHARREHLVIDFELVVKPSPGWMPSGHTDMSF